MLFNVAGLLREPVGAVRRYVLEPEAPVHRGRVEFVRTPGGILARVEADVVIDASCSRCLAPFGYPAHVSFEEIWYQQVDPVTGTRLAHEDADEESFLIGLDHTIDIREAVRQYSEMAAAMQPLCRPDCPGLCPECGRDLTTEECACDRAPVDARWSALASLKHARNG